MVLPGGLGVAVGHPDHDRLLQAEHVAEVGREVGEHRQLGRARVAEHRRHPVGAEEVEGGFADSRHRTEPYPCREQLPEHVGGAAGQDSSGEPVVAADQGGVSQPPVASAGLAPRAILALCRCPALRCRRRTPSAAEPPPSRDHGSSTAPGKIVPIPASIPHEEGDMVDRRIIPDLRWIAKRYPIYVTDGYSGPLPNGEHAGCDDCHVSNSDHYNGLAVDIVPLDAELQMRRQLDRRSPASPSGPSRSRTNRCRPSAGSATTATPATAAATTCTSPGTTPSRPVPARRMGRSPSRSPRSRKPEATRETQTQRRNRKPPPAPPAASPRCRPAASPPGPATELAAALAAGALTAAKAIRNQLRAGVRPRRADADQQGLAADSQPAFGGGGRLVVP